MNKDSGLMIMEKKGEEKREIGLNYRQHLHGKHLLG
jgi:hypothetical protein